MCVTLALSYCAASLVLLRPPHARNAKRIDAAWDGASGGGTARRVRPATAPATGLPRSGTGKKKLQQQQQQQQRPERSEQATETKKQDDHGGKPELARGTAAGDSHERVGLSSRVPLGKERLLRSERLNNDPQVRPTTHYCAVPGLFG